MNNCLITKKVDSLLDEIKNYIESRALSDNDLHLLKSEIDKLVYECLYYKTKLVS